MTAVTPQQPLHPLRAKELRLIPTWSEWRKLWEAEVHPECLIGLLHIGFDVPLDTEVSDRILFYLSIADGHASGIGSWEEERRELSYTSFGRHITWARIRQRVAQKSFQELCRRVFKNTEPRDRVPSWLATLTSDSYRVLNAVLAFFLECDPVWIQQGQLLRNLPRDAKCHECGIAVSFLTDLCTFAWNSFLLPNYGDGPAIEENLRQRRPQLVRVLAGLNNLSFLEEMSSEDLDDACCEELKRVALGEKLHLPTGPDWRETFRLPETLEEAVVGRSKAARVLLLHMIWQKELKRCEQLQELARTQRAAAEAIQKLSPPRA